MTEKNLATLFQNRVYRFGSRPALSYKAAGQWIWLDWDELGVAVEQTGRGFIASGIEPGTHVAIFSNNRPEWVFTDLAVQSVGAVSVPIHAEASANQAEFILKHCGAEFLAVGNKEQLDRVLPVRPNLPKLKKTVCFDETAVPENDFVLTFSSLRKLGQGVSSAAFYERVENVGADDVSTMLYASGTEEDPKGTLLTHRNILTNLLACGEVLPVTEEDTSLSFLPLSHPFERAAGTLALLSLGAKVAFAENFTKVWENLPEVKPTVLFCAPRALEEFFRGVQEEIAARSRPSRFFLKKGSERRHAALANSFFDLLFYRKIRNRFGPNIQQIVSAGASLDPKIARFFEIVGIQVLKLNVHGSEFLINSNS